MAASVMTGAISLANSVTAPSNRGSLALPVFFFGKKLLNTVPAILLADELPAPWTRPAARRY